MTNQEAIEILTAKAECMRRETSGIDIDCNYRNCDECDLCYKQGTTGDQIEALCVAISALQAQDVPVINVGDMISRRKAIDALGYCQTYLFDSRDKDKKISLEDAEYAIEQLTSAQPEIVRCKDCKYYIPYEWMFDGLSKSSHIKDYSPDEIGCSVNDHNYPPDGYCSCAERREE